MVIGVPKEIKDHEYRVSMTPEGVRTLRQAGHEIWIEPSAGAGSGYSDEEYLRAGGSIAQSKADVFERAALIVKVKEPQLSECRFFRPGQTLFTYLHLASSPDLTTALLDSKISAIAYETVEAKNGMRPMLHPMSDIAGRMSVQIGARYLEKTQGGRGVLLWGAWRRTGKRRRAGGWSGGQRRRQDCRGHGGAGDGHRSGPRTAAILGRSIPRKNRHPCVNASGHRGIGAGRGFGHRSGVGPRRSRAAIDISRTRRPHEARSGDRRCGGRSRRLRGDHQAHQSLGAGLCGGWRSPLRCANMPGIVPRTSTGALTNATLPYVLTVAGKGVEAALRADTGFAKGLTLTDGKVTCRAVAEAHGLRFDPMM